MNGLKTDQNMTKLLVAACLTAAAFLSNASPAEACGGFFCNNINPIEQSGEQILFVDNGDKVRSYIRINYVGDSEAFAWVVPVASVPDVGVGTDDVFTQLDQRTSPYFWLEYDWNPDCPFDMYYPEVAAGSDSDFSNDRGVNILGQDQAGPYNYTILESSNTAALVAWLNENDYEQPPEATALIEHYVAQEMTFVAIKLQNDKSAGDIVPLVLDFEEANPCVPLVLTQVAATPDMPIKIWTLSESRAIPTNWMHVTINEKKIDWLNSGSNYNQVVTEAIDEANGHAFTTEYAGPSDIMENAIYWEEKFNGYESLGQMEDPADFVMGIQSYFTASTQLLNLLRTHAPMPQAAIDAGIGENQFYNNPENYQEYYDMIDFDPAAFLAALTEVIVDPAKEAQAMFDEHPYLTRLYSTVSPEEMNWDPIFDFSSDLPDVSNAHTAKLTTTCDGEKQYISIELENGETFTPVIPDWYWNGDNIDQTGAIDLDTEPAAERIELMSPTQLPRLVDPEMVDYVDSQLEMMPTDRVDVPQVDTNNPGEAAEASKTGAGCSAASGSPAGTGLVLMAMFLVFACLRSRESRRLG